MTKIFQHVTKEILTILNSDTSLKNMMEQVVELIYKETRYAAIGMRIKNGDDYPYFAQTGFTQVFLKTENSLIHKKSSCNIIESSLQDRKLECTCGLVIAGSDSPALTPSGSFWTNNSFLLLDIPAEDDPRYRPRNQCVHAGYGSFAIIPIYAHGEVIGTLQLNDYKTNAFNDEIIRFYERTCLSIGIAFMRKQAEESLAESERFLKEVQDIADIGGYAYNLQTGLWQGNEVMNRIFGIGPQYETSYENWLAIIHPDDRDMMAAYFENDVLTQKQQFDKVYRIVRKNDGAERWVHGFGILSYDNHGLPIKMVGTIMDITEKMLAEIERDQLIERLTRRNLDLEQFSFIVSHNLRSPLVNLMGLAQIMTEPEFTTDKGRDMLKHMFNAVDRLDNIIKDLNTILNLKHDAQRERERVNFSEIVEDIESSVADLIKYEQAEIVTDFSEVSEMLTVKSFLHSILFNLISNSLKYRKPHLPPHIEIATRKHQGKIELTFRDNGMGIDLTRTRNQLFGLYKKFHFHKSGTGMGLFMVKTQVDLLGGNLEIDSQVDAGTTFKIMLPIC